MNGQIACNFVELKNTITEIEKQIALLDLDFMKLYTDLDALNATWDGPSYDELIRSNIRDMEIIDNYRKDLVKVVEKLKKCMKEYAVAEIKIGELTERMKL